jgi:hypothetical protein
MDCRDEPGNDDGREPGGRDYSDVVITRLVPVMTTSAR